MEVVKIILILAAVIGLGLASFGVTFGKFHPGWGGLCILAAAYALSITVKV